MVRWALFGGRERVTDREKTLRERDVYYSVGKAGRGREIEGGLYRDVYY